MKKTKRPQIATPSQYVIAMLADLQRTLAWYMQEHPSEELKGVAQGFDHAIDSFTDMYERHCQPMIVVSTQLPLMSDDEVRLWGDLPF